MTSTSSVAAAASMVIPFHCVICFDEFNLKDRTPMVLPCGHTYVCLACTKRLKRCMECRQPLYWIPPVTSTPAVSPPLISSQFRGAPARYGRPQTNVNTNVSSNLSGPRSPPRKPTRITAPAQTQFPMPRNVVMIAMMEAAQSQMSVEDRQEEAERGENEEEEGIEISSIMEAQEGIEALSGVSGTYAVTDSEGLAVLPSDPRKRNDAGSSPANVQDPFNIHKGQTVQVVQVGDGVYKLARGRGYIVASDSQLVKVGGPRDSSCRLEGIQDMINVRKQALLDQLEKVECLSLDLSNRIAAANSEEPSHPIIADSREEDDLFHEDCRPVLNSPLQCATSPQRRGHAELAMPDVSSPHATRRAPRTPNSIDNSDLREYADENVFPGESPYLCSPFSFLSLSQDSEDQPRRLIAGRSFEEPSRMRPRLSPQQARQGIAPSPSMGSVNFSTGMSGHRGLSSKSSRGNLTAQRQIRMMGEHRGLSLFRGPKNTST